MSVSRRGRSWSVDHEAQDIHSGFLADDANGQSLKT